MSRQREFPFSRARRITARELEGARRAIERVTGAVRRRRGRPPKPAGERYRAVSIRLHPKVLGWARRVAGKRNVGYQTVINEVLLRTSLAAERRGSCGSRRRRNTIGS